MNLETRDRLDTLLDDARLALLEAGTTLMRTDMHDDTDWTVYGMIVAAAHELRGAIDALPTVHSLKVEQARADCVAETLRRTPPSAAGAADASGKQP
jgi:hypothetical protein